MTCEILVSLQFMEQTFFIDVHQEVVGARSYLSFWFQERVKYLKYILFI